MAYTYVHTGQRKARSTLTVSGGRLPTERHKYTETDVTTRKAHCMNHYINSHCMKEVITTTVPIEHVLRKPINSGVWSITFLSVFVLIALVGMARPALVGVARLGRGVGQWLLCQGLVLVLGLQTRKGERPGTYCTTVLRGVAAWDRGYSGVYITCYGRDNTKVLV